MTLFRKRPVVIDAWRHSDQPTNTQPDWLCDAIEAGVVRLVGGEPSCYDIQTLEGTMRCEKGDWIIRGIKGELYPCKPDIFDATYEAV